MVLGRFWTRGPQSAGAGGTVSGGRESQNIVPSRPPRWSSGIRVPPPRVAALGPHRQRQGAGSALTRAGKVLRVGAPVCRPARRGIPLTGTAGPGRSRAGEFPGRGARCFS